MPARRDEPMTLSVGLLRRLGWPSLPRNVEVAILRRASDALETSVGLYLARQFTERELDQFEVFMEMQDEPGARRWLQQNHPEYTLMVRREYERLLAWLGALGSIVTAYIEAISVPAPDETSLESESGSTKAQA